MGIKLPLIKFMFVTLAIIVEFTNCSDDYEYLNRMHAQAQRMARSQGADDRLDGLYSLESSANHLYLTARKGRISPGPVVLKKWSDSASQLWGITKFDTSRGYNMKPLENEFNFVTSTLKNNAHAYNAWEFKKQSSPNTYIIFNTLNRRCLQTSSLNQDVRFEKCQPTSFNQHWKLNKIE